MWIEILLLAELTRRPLHGYELRREIEAATGRSLSNDSLYPRLRRFVEADSVRRRTEKLPGVPTRHVYSITDAGREVLHDLLAEPPEDTTDNRKEFLARVLHFDLLTTGERLRILDAQDAVLERRREHVAGLAQARTGGWGRRVLDYGTARLNMDRVWLAQVRADVVAEAGPVDSTG
ncbi:PadR family transcriptional regulator [Streptomyces shenzhenensis]|uniref:PadR family transcriptional regulator n=1 Tax=Streptomyces shenzhenensis TaxID=943815 RepID=A0A3M0IJG8_9ACTN|nr:PadR family transcriptional regulator [Streptomyces shenzhenensis]RMB87033.1 PadR family transcriptional regulator [Streptomyces shenzhenensis]